MLSKLQDMQITKYLFVEKIIYLSHKHCEILYMINNINQKYYQKCYINRSCATHICKSLLCMITTEIIFDTWIWKSGLIMLLRSVRKAILYYKVKLDNSELLMTVFYVYP